MLRNSIDLFRFSSHQLEIEIKDCSNHWRPFFALLSTERYQPCWALSCWLDQNLILLSSKCRIVDKKKNKGCFNNSCIKYSVLFGFVPLINSIIPHVIF